MKPILCTILLVFFFTSCNSQDQEKLKRYIPEGYLLHDTFYGDLNEDGLKEVVLLIKATDTSKIVANRFHKIVDRNRRGIVVLFKTSKGYKLVAQNNECFESENEEGYGYYPPQLKVEIENTQLLIQYKHGKYGYWTYTFMYIEEALRLTRYDRTSAVGPTIVTELAIDFIKNEKRSWSNMIPYEEGNNPNLREEVTKIEAQPLMKLQEVKAFEDLYYN